MDGSERTPAVDVCDEPAGEPVAAAEALYDDDDASSDDDDEESDVALGFAVSREAPILRNHFLSKLGGAPAWLDPARLPLSSELRCKATDKPLRFLLQLYAPTDEDDPRAFHRMLYLFISPKGSKLAEPGAVRAFRCQLPRRNAFYPYDPPEADELPRGLSATESRLAARRCPGQHAEAAAASPAPAPGDTPSAASAHEATGPVFPEHFPEHELVVEPEPAATDAAESNPEVARVLEQYEEGKRALLVAKDGQAGQGANPEEDGEEANDLSAFDGARNPEVEDFAEFSIRVSRAPNQCIRYTHASAAAPLWASKKRQPKAGDIPCCERCGSPRRFEFQVMPQAISYLNVDSADDDAPDWATIAVYTCSASCAPLPALPAAGGGLVDPPKGAAGQVFANAAVGLRCRIRGLETRSDLNGQECSVLHWYPSTGRWAIECEGTGEGGCNEQMRIKSANLTVLHPFRAGQGEEEEGTEGARGSSDERDGGYAEEFVFVQPH